MSLLEAAGTVGSTSCSVSMKNLTKTPIFCDGSTLVLLTSPAGASNSTSTTRSLFGGGGGLSGLRCKNPLGTFFPSCFSLSKHLGKNATDAVSLLWPLCLNFSHWSLWSFVNGASLTYLGNKSKSSNLWICLNIIFQFIFKFLIFHLVLASNMCFNVETGQFNSRSDLSDAPTCALGRGAPLQALGKFHNTIYGTLCCFW